MKDFILYPEALELKQLGFDEPSFAWYHLGDTLLSDITIGYEKTDFLYTQDDMEETQCTAPTYSQAFRWFREKHNLESFIVPSVNEQDKTIYRFAFGNLSKSIKYDFEDRIDYQFEEYETYEEAELACLKKLIEIVKTK